MSGIQDLPICVCRSCKTVWMPDDRMYLEPDRCPKCGREIAESEIRGEGGNDVETWGE